MDTWPTTTQVSDALEEAGIPTPSGSRLSSALALAKEAFEDATGWYPFAAVEDAEPASLALSWPADAGVSIIDLGGGLLPGEDITLTLDDTTLTITDDYELRPTDAARKRLPYTYLKLVGRRIGWDSALSITGVWGYCAYDAVPELARQAVVAHCCMAIGAPSVQAGTADRTVTEEEQGQVDLKYGTSIEERQSAMRLWKADWETGVRKYRRQSVR